MDGLGLLTSRWVVVNKISWKLVLLVESRNMYVGESMQLDLVVGDILVSTTA